MVEHLPNSSVIEHLPNLHETLDSIPNNAKKKKEEEEERRKQPQFISWRPLYGTLGNLCLILWNDGSPNVARIKVTRKTQISDSKGLRRRLRNSVVTS